MHVQKYKSADLPRRRLSLRFDKIPTADTLRDRASLSSKELQRIVAEMVG